MLRCSLTILMFLFNIQNTRLQTTAKLLNLMFINVPVLPLQYYINVFRTALNFSFSLHQNAKSYLTLFLVIFVRISIPIFHFHFSGLASFQFQFQLIDRVHIHMSRGHTYDVP